MRKIAIIGGGLAGFHAAFSLQQAGGYDVTVYTNRTAEQLQTGRMLSMAAPFRWVLERESSLGINFWEEVDARAEGFDMHIKDPAGSGKDLFRLTGKFPDGLYALGIDYRLKFSTWMNEWERRGGKLVVRDISVTDLEEIAAGNDLTLVVTGRGPLSQIFDKDEDRSTHNLPPLPSAAIFLSGPKVSSRQPWEDVPFSPLRFDILPGVGDVFSWPFYTEAGICRGFAFQSTTPGGPFDAGKDRQTAAAFLKFSREATDKLIPDNGFLFDGATIPDEGAWLYGPTEPMVRQPVKQLANGAWVWGMGDAAMIQDPYAGQSGNNAVRMTDLYVRHILERGDAPYESDWMQSVWDEHWEQYGKFAFRFCTLLQDAPNKALMTVQMAAARDPAIAQAFVGWFGYPPNAWPYIEDEQAAKRFVAEHAMPTSAQAAAI